MLETIKDMNALITGSALRIGRAIALRLAKEGVNLVLHYNSSEKEVENLLNELKQFPIKATKIKTNLMEPHSANFLFEQALEVFSEINILINNASIFPIKTFETLSYEDFIDSIHIHGWTPFQLARCMKQQDKKGVVINFLDTRLWDYDAKHLSYYFGKQLLRVITRSLAIELAPHIRVNGIAPGLILPPQGETEEYLARLSKTNLLKMYGNLSDVEESVSFLIKSDFITGQVIFLDGGRFLLGSMNNGTI